MLLPRQQPDDPSDPVDPPAVGFSRARIDVNEDSGVAIARIELSRAASETTSVYLATNGDSARPGADFYGYSERLVFNAGETEKQVAIAILDDTEQENDEQFGIRLFDHNGLVLARKQMTVNIQDNDDGSVPAVSIGSVSVSEANRTAEVPVTLSHAAATAVTVDVATQPDQAINKEDFYGLHQTITFAPGETEKQVRVIIIDDARPEADESFGLSLFSVDGASYGDRRATVTITNDD